jgi:hypothetical protein
MTCSRMTTILYKAIGKLVLLHLKLHKRLLRLADSLLKDGLTAEHPQPAGSARGFLQAGSDTMHPPCLQETRQQRRTNC